MKEPEVSTKWARRLVCIALCIILLSIMLHLMYLS